MNLRIPQVLTSALIVACAITTSAQPTVTETVNPDNLVLREHRDQQLPKDYGLPVREADASLNASANPRAGVFEPRTAVDNTTSEALKSDGLTAGAVPQDPPGHPASRLSSPTIDTMTLEDETVNYEPYLPIGMLQHPDNYVLSDGSTWSSGAGSFGYGRVLIDTVQVVGTTVRYTFTGFDDGILLNFTDYNSGDHSAVGRLDLVDGLTITAELGSTVAAVQARLVVVENAPANYTDERFNYFSAIIDSVVPATFNIENQSGTWQEDTFDNSLTYRITDGVIDFANPISTPLQTGLSVLGTTQLPPNAEVSMTAIAQYDNGALRDVTTDASWSIDPDAATISDTGVISTGDAPADDQPIMVTAQYEGFTGSLDALVIGSSTLSEPQDFWATFQGDVAHTGYVGGATDPADFTVRWETSVADTTLNQAAVADGKVFVTVPSRFIDRTHVIALDLVDGEPLWTRQLGPVNSINPPAYGYGSVYVQTGKATSSLPPMVHALSAETGDTIFESIFAAQWETYQAPTISDGRIYVNGGYYGGMYRFNAFSGEEDWFEPLPQYDGWTPSLSGDTAYGYVGGSFVALDRETGERRYTLQDPNWDWNGYDMRGAVAIEGERAVAMHNRRLLTVDLSSPPRILWDRLDNFVGQPALAQGVIYVVQATQLKAISVETGADLWSWSAPAGQTLSGPVTLTDTHVFLSAENTTFAIDILAQDDVWSYTAGGQLSVGQDHLLIAQANGTVTAIAMPVILDSPVASVEIAGPDSVEENTSADFRAMVTYEDGRVRDRSVSGAWAMKDSTVASLDDNGRLSVVQLDVPRQTLGIGVSYTEGDVTVADERFVQLYTPLTNTNFALRGIEGANLIKRSVLEQLIDAKRLELSARFALAGSQDADDIAALNELITALQTGQSGINSVELSTEALQRALDILQIEAGGQL